MTGPTFGAYLRRRWWLIALQAIVAVVAVTAVIAATAKTSHSRVTHFVLHPDESSPVGEVNNSVDVLQHDGPLVQTVRNVLGSDEIRERTAREAKIGDASGYAITATVAPGTNVFDVEVVGPAAATAARLGDALETVAPAYVETSYRGFALDVLGREATTNDPFPPRADVLLLALLLGATVAVGVLFAAFAWRHARADAVVADLHPDARVAAGNGDGRAKPAPVPAKARPRGARRNPSASA